MIKPILIVLPLWFGISLYASAQQDNSGAKTNIKKQTTTITSSESQNGQVSDSGKNKPAKKSVNMADYCRKHTC